MTRRLAVLAGAAALCLATAAPAAAQVIRTRPLPGLFGTGDPAKSDTQIDFISFLGGGYESTTLSADEAGREAVSDDSSFGNLVFRGRLAHQGRRRTFGANGGATTSYYTGATGLSPLSLSAGTSFGGQIGRRGTFALRQSMFYSPYYVLRAVTSERLDAPDAEPDPIEPEADPSVDPRLDQRALRLSTKGYSSFATIGQQLGRSGSLFASYSLNYTDFGTRVFDVLAQSPRAGYRHRVGRFASLIASYGVQSYEYRNSPFARLISQNVALGVGYDRPLSAWRRTTVGFNMSTAVIRNRNVLRAHLNGTARLHRRFGRTWVGGVTYTRGQQVLEGFAEPFFTFSDTASVSFAGRLGRDVGLSGRASYSHNRYSIDAFSNVFDTTAASMRLQVPVMWALAAYVEGYYADHNFRQRLGLLEGIPTSLDRIGTRAGLTVSVPVFR